MWRQPGSGDLRRAHAPRQRVNQRFTRKTTRRHQGEPLLEAFALFRLDTKPGASERNNLQR